MIVGLYAWTTRLPDGSTSLVGTIIDGRHTPLIATRVDLAAAMQPLAEAHAQASGQDVYLEHFTHAKTLHKIGQPDTSDIAEASADWFARAKRKGPPDAR